MLNARSDSPVRSRVLIYTDCSFFAGCENMPANLVNDPAINEEFDVVFAYRHSRRYAAGASVRIAGEARTVPLSIPTVESALEATERLGIPWLAPALKRTGLLAALKYFFAAYAAVILFFEFKKTAPDVLHINNGGYPGAYSCVAAVLAARAAGIKKIVFVVNSIAVPYESFQRKIERPIDRFVARNVSVFITGSRYAGDRLSGLLGLPRQKVLTIPNGIAPRPMKEAKDSVLRRLGIPAGSIVLGNVAVLEPRKGHRYLLQALALARAKFDRFSEVVLVIEGEGSERENLERLADELDLKKNARFISGEKNIFDVINAFDVFILPSVGYEDFPNVILEAMSLGKPVIGTRVAGIPEQVLDGRTGLVVEPADAGSLSAALLRLISDEEERRDMGERARERFNAAFSYDRSILAYAELYRTL